MSSEKRENSQPYQTSLWPVPGPPFMHIKSVIGTFFLQFWGKPRRMSHLGRGPGKAVGWV